MQALNQSINAASNIINSTNVTGVTTGVGAMVGGAIGSAIPGVGTMAGSMIGGSIGGLVGGLTSSFIPSYSTIKGSNVGINFTTFNLKPYWLEYHTPTKEELIKLDAIYKYYGCATHRTEPLNTANYMYQNHAYVKGDLQYNNSIGLKYFSQINNIFNRGVHIIQ